MSEDTQGTASPPAEGTTADQVADKGTEQQVTEGQPEGEQQAEQAGETQEGEQTERKRLSGAQKAKRRETYLLNQLAERERELQEFRQASRKPEGEQGGADKPPKEEDFNGDWTAYVAARAAYEAGKAVEGKLDAREAVTRETRRSEAERELALAFQDQLDEAREVISDFDKVLKGVASPAKHVLREIQSSEKGALIAYELARNPDRMDALNHMTPMELAREMGRLEASVKMPSGKKATTTPPPPSTIKGGAAPSFNAEKASMAEYAAEFARRMKG